MHRPCRLSQTFHKQLQSNIPPEYIVEMWRIPPDDSIVKRDPYYVFVENVDDQYDPKMVRQCLRKTGAKLLKNLDLVYVNLIVSSVPRNIGKPVICSEESLWAHVTAGRQTPPLIVDKAVLTNPESDSLALRYAPVSSEALYHNVGRLKELLTMRKIVLLVGETGCGKSAALDVCCNECDIRPLHISETQSTKKIKELCRDLAGTTSVFTNRSTPCIIIDSPESWSTRKLNDTIREASKRSVGLVILTSDSRFVRKVPSKLVQIISLSSISPDFIKHRLTEIAYAESIDHTIIDQIVRRAKGNLRQAIIMLEESVSKTSTKLKTPFDVAKMAFSPSHKKRYHTWFRYADQSDIVKLDRYIHDGIVSSTYGIEAVSDALTILSETDCLLDGSIEGYLVGRYSASIRIPTSEFSTSRAFYRPKKTFDASELTGRLEKRALTTAT